METGTIANWKVEAGAAFQAGDVICEIETDKATVDFEAQDEGVLAKILVEAGKEVAVGSPIAVVVEDPTNVAAFADFKAAPATPPGEAAPEPPAAATAQKSPLSVVATGPVRLMPAAQHLAHSRHIDVTGLTGSGKGGRITKGDILAALAAGVEFPQIAAAPAPEAAVAATTSTSPSILPATTATPVAATKAATGPWQKAPRIAYDEAAEVTSGAPFEDEAASGMRKVISKRLAESRAYVPHSFTTATVELDDIAKLRKTLAAEFGIKVSVNDVVIRACALALRDVPRANSSWVDDTATPNESVDISVAVATPTGLITPIVTNADQKGLAQISAEVRDLATRARDGKLKPEEYQGGTFTISNLGMFGIQEFSAVINPPQACILAVGGGSKEFVNVPGQEPRPATLMTSRLSSDRRVVDEPLAALFMQVFSHYMANPKLLVV